MKTDERATQILADFRERLDRGEPVDADEVVRAHPDLAEKLRGRLAALSRLNRAFAQDAASPAAPPLTGRMLGPYRLAQALGTGGMGTVYLASVEGRASGLAAGERVAVKVVHPHLLLREGFFKRFLREAEIGRRLRHENVVRTLDADAVPLDGAQAHFLVLEYVEGQTLRELLAEVTRAPEELCRHVGREVAKGLVAIHAAGAVHRDLKPDNVLITKDHVVKVMDLGVARQDDEALRVSQTGAFVGSVRYAAPEQFGLVRAAGANEAIPRSREGEARSAKGDRIDGRADLYALGLVLYEMATGAHPFAGDDFHVVLRRQMTETPRPAGEVNPQLSPFFEELLKTLLAKDPDQRFASAADLLAALTEGEKSAWWHDRAVRVRAETRRPLRRIRIPRETALYGRDAELATLRAVYERAQAGDGQVVVVEGEAGIGKSRLVDEFVGLLQREGEDVHFLFGSYPPGGAATASGAFSTAYREHFGEETLEDALREALPVTPLLVPAFAALLRGDAAPSGAEALTKDSLQTVFVHATRSLAKERTTIVLIDDLHFAPEEGRGLFASLALATPGHRMLLVGTARPGLPQDWLVNVERTAHVTRLPLPRLGPKDLVRLLADTLKSERLAEELSGRIAVKSDGNPFFVFEILRGLREGQFLTQRPDGTWATTQILRDIQVPSTIQDLVRARIGDLDAEDKDVLDVASCLGFEFDAGVVADALGVPRLPVLRRLARIEARHRLVRSAGERFVFDHHQVQETLYASLPPPLAREYHAAIASAIEARTGAASKDPKDVEGAVCVDLAEHFLDGGLGPRALRYLDAALTHLERSYLNEAAVALADRTLAAPGLLFGRARAELFLRSSVRFDILGRRDAQRAALDEAAALSAAEDDAALCARVHRGRGVLSERISRYEEARAHHELQLAIARELGDRLEEARATGSLGVVFRALDRYEDAQAHHERSLAIAREIGDRQTEANATGNLGIVLHTLGRSEEARALLEQNLAITREIGPRRDEGYATGNLSNLLGHLGRYEEARVHCERQLAIAREIGDRRIEQIANGYLGNVACALGFYAQARSHWERHIAIAREIGDRRGEGIATGNLGELFLAFGRCDEARSRLEWYLGLSREIGNLLAEAVATGKLGNLFLALGRCDEARTFHERSLALSRTIGDPSWNASALIDLGATLAEHGRFAEAASRLDEAVSIARTIGHPSILVLAAAERGRLPGGDPKSAVELLARHASRVTAIDAVRVRHILWQATHDPAHLAEAKRRLDFLVEHAPPEYRESMLTNVRLHREIAAAAREHLGG